MQRMKQFKIYGRNDANYPPENFKIELMQLSNHQNLMYIPDSVDTQIQILREFFTSSRLLRSI